MSNSNNKIKYYSCEKVLSYNKPYTFAMSNRGTGKTTDFTRFIVKRFLEKGLQFIYLKRCYEDIISTAPEFFNSDYLKMKFPGHEFEFKKKKFYIDGQIAGYPMVLNTPTRNKGIPLEHIGTILFDEFLTEDNRYITTANNPYQEVHNLCSLIETINRGVGRLYREELKVIMLANSVSLINPYFACWDIDKAFVPGKRFMTGRDWVLEFFIDEDIARAKAESPFGRMAQKAGYGDYAFGNQFYLDNNAFIEDIKPHYWHHCNLIYAGETYGIYEDKKKGIFYISEKYDPRCLITYALSDEDHNENTYALSRKQDLYKNLVENFEYGNVRFSSMRCKTVLLTFLNRCK